MRYKAVLGKFPDFWNGWERFWEFHDFSWDFFCFESINTVRWYEKRNCPKNQNCQKSNECPQYPTASSQWLRRTPPSKLWPQVRITFIKLMYTQITWYAKRLSQALACFAATMGSFVMGTAIGWSGPALPLLQANTTDSSSPPEGGLKSLSDFAVTDDDATWIASLMPLGALFGGMEGIAPLYLCWQCNCQGYVDFAAFIFLQTCLLYRDTLGMKDVSLSLYGHSFYLGFYW